MLQSAHPHDPALNDGVHAELPPPSSDDPPALAALRDDLAKLGLTPAAADTDRPPTPDGLRLIWRRARRRDSAPRPLLRWWHTSSRVSGQAHTDLTIDFVHGALGWRRQHAGPEALLARLRDLPRGAAILDASTGLGRDAALLVSRGFRVVAYERNPWVYVLLRHAHREWLRVEPDLAARLELRFGDAREAFGRGDTPPADAAIFDPMFPPGRSNAAVRGELRVLQRLTHSRDDRDLAQANEVDAAETLATLVAHCARVVVKRPPQAPILDPERVGQRPRHQVTGTTVRFDVYRRDRTLGRDTNA